MRNVFETLEKVMKCFDIPEEVKNEVVNKLESKGRYFEFIQILEKSFNNINKRYTVKWLRFSTLLGIFLYILGTIVDIIFAPKEKMVVFLINFLVVVPAAIIFIALTYKIKNIKLLETLFSFLIICTGLFNLVHYYFLPEEGKQWIFYGLSLIILFSYVFQRFKYALFTSLTLTIFYIVTVPLFIKLNKYIFSVNILFLTIENIILIICSYLKEKTFIKDIFFSVFAAQSNNNLKRLSYIDGLTGIPNRRYFEKQLEREWKRAIRTKRPISLLMIDIDYFKKLNDTLGHLEGDWALREIARIISENLRKDIDVVARYGGEEFVVILPETDVDEAKEVAERIRKAIERNCIEHPSSPISNCVTVSIGVATLIPQENQAKEILIKLADEALYQAKRQGRNKISHIVKDMN